MQQFIEPLHLARTSRPVLAQAFCDGRPAAYPDIADCGGVVLGPHGELHIVRESQPPVHTQERAWPSRGAVSMAKKGFCPAANSPGPLARSMAVKTALRKIDKVIMSEWLLLSGESDWLRCGVFMPVSKWRSDSVAWVAWDRPLTDTDKGAVLRTWPLCGHGEQGHLLTAARDTSKAQAEVKGYCQLPRLT